MILIITCFDILDSYKIYGRRKKWKRWVGGGEGDGVFSYYVLNKTNAIKSERMRQNSAKLSDFKCLNFCLTN